MLATHTPIGTSLKKKTRPNSSTLESVLEKKYLFKVPQNNHENSLDLLETMTLLRVILWEQMFTSLIIIIKYTQSFSLNTHTDDSLKYTF